MASMQKEAMLLSGNTAFKFAFSKDAVYLCSAVTYGLNSQYSNLLFNLLNFGFDSFRIKWPLMHSYMNVLIVVVLVIV